MSGDDDVVSKGKLRNNRYSLQKQTELKSVAAYPRIEENNANDLDRSKQRE